jgi:hypothetical protein
LRVEPFKHVAEAVARCSPMLSPHQKRTLRKLDCSEWKPAKLPWVSDKTVTTLVTLGFLEEKQDESHARFVRLTDKGRRLVEEGRY